MDNPNPSSQPLTKRRHSNNKNPFRQKNRSSRATRQVLTPDGRINIFRLGEHHTPWGDLYHLLLTMTWIEFLGLVSGLYFVTNLLFAIAYLLGGDCIANAKPGSLTDAFFFSVQTMATIGYGALYPKTTYAHLLVTIEALIGLLGVAIATGLMFARFSRPTARVLFSNTAVIMPYNGVPTLMFRAGNKRGNQILEARLWVTLLREESTLEGYSIRRIYDLKLTRSHSPFFVLSWTGMHPIDEDSPLYGETIESLVESSAEILITLTGTDETVAQTVHARHAYAVKDILWNYKFVDVFSFLPTGERVLDFTLFHDVVPLQRD